MGGNGSKSSGKLETEEGREYYSVFNITDNIIVIESKKKNRNVKLPEESHSPNRIYVVINKPAKDDGKWINNPYAGKLKSIGVYGYDCKKKYEIHLDHIHDGMHIHYHPWENGKPISKGNSKYSVAYPLTSEMNNLLEFIKKYVPHV